MNRSALTGWLSGANVSLSAGDRSARSAPPPAAKPGSPATSSVNRPGAKVAETLTVSLLPSSAEWAAPVSSGPAVQTGQGSPG
jgi:hypothetical protein